MDFATKNIILKVTPAVIALLLVASSLTNGCPYGFDYQFSSSCYHIVTEEGLPHDDARASCESESSHLVYIETEEEQTFLRQSYSSSYEYWLGVSGSEESLTTWDDGTGIELMNFGDIAYAFNQRTGCYRIVPLTTNHYWYDEFCSYSLGYICEYEIGIEPSGCPPGYNFKFLSSCYHIYTISELSRQNARAACESQSSHLVFIETEEEQNFLSDTYSPDFEYWIGANGDEQATKTWDDGTVIGYSNFGDHEYAFNAETGCYRIVPWTANDDWYDDLCYFNHGYICEYELDLPHETTSVASSTAQHKTTSELASTVPMTTTADVMSTKASTTVTPASTVQMTTTADVTSTKASTTVTLASTVPMTTTAAVTSTKASTTVTPDLPPNAMSTKMFTTKESATEVLPGIDVGVLLGGITLGTVIPANSKVLPIVDHVTSTQCARECVRRNCYAMSYDVILHTCDIVVPPGNIQTERAYTFSKLFLCRRLNGLTICV